jgi:flagellar assembly protein FliH
MPKIYKLPKIGKSITISVVSEKESTDKLKQEIQDLKEYLQQLEKTKQEKEKELAYLKDRIINEAKLIADRILKEAHDEEKELLDTARQEAASLKEKAYQEGLELGKQQTYKLLEERINAFSEEFNKLVKRIFEEKDNFLKEIKSYVIDLIFLITEKILKERINLKKDLLLVRIEEAIKDLSVRTNLKVSLNPKDKELFEKFKDKLIKTYNLTNLELKLDDSIDPGEFIIETQLGTIDAKIASQLERIKEVLK